MSGTYYCHECECRRVITPISTCASCGCCYVEEIPSVLEEEEDMLTDYDEDFNRELDFFYIHEGQEDEEEELLLEERCLYEQLSSMYNHPIARNFDSDSMNEMDERQRIDELLSSITDGGEAEAREEDDIVAYDVHFEQRINHNQTTSDEPATTTTTTTSRFQLPFARIGRLLETLYDSVSDEESDERDDEIHSYNRRSFLDNLADILLDYTQDIETSTQQISNRALDHILSSLKKRVMSVDDPDAEDECIICQEAFGTTLEVFHLPCNHKFHGECITRWLKIKTSCPVCRQNAGNENDEDAEVGELEVSGVTHTSSTTSNTTGSHSINSSLHNSNQMDHLLATAEQVEHDFGYISDQDLIDRRDRLQRLRQEIVSRRTHWLSSSPTNYQLNAPSSAFHQSYSNELFNHVFPQHTFIDDVDWTNHTSSMEEVD